MSGLSGLSGMWHKGTGSAEVDRMEWLRAKEEAKAVDALDSLMACFKGKLQPQQQQQQQCTVTNATTILLYIDTIIHSQTHYSFTHCYPILSYPTSIIYPIIYHVFRG